MGVYPVVSKSDLEHMAGALIAEKPVIVEVRDSDEAGDLFESISNENEKNAIFDEIPLHI
ncbi:hypothetical protein J056_002797 [Wallemia ichthyophaga EXF-994]|uniref:Uncharacterized protein n=1 Tax=Wallemia ichthyophaga (strain EXF-994 / CBS 113033) TaxID=1299270 RepID=R9A9Y7_WALI9|nr:uncharacterized protein J056_002797 [Wallemia ichthyophaga EXF-994]EOQ98844.1 hypothetical protein J056_002797 [Wallemia ichthyophaga EXF-994]